VFFEDFDLTLFPVTMGPAGSAPVQCIAFNSFVKTAGISGISIPVAFSADGTPIGFQLAGRFGYDWESLAMARRYERPIHAPPGSLL
jgi:Asp-tRNA(Asn)/Glu-tRNA(Gln) amidotransferase A subunit family amidase